MPFISKDAQAILRQQQSSNYGTWKSRFVDIGEQDPTHIELIKQGLFDEAVFNVVGFNVMHRIDVLGQ